MTGLSPRPVPIGASGASAAALAGGRLHLQHGPIDLVIKASGAQPAVARAYRLAALRFESVLPELVQELVRLRQPAGIGGPLTGGTARRMQRAARCFSDRYFITPMAAVAGGVADEVLAAMLAETDGLVRLFVNNGGDIALWNAGEEPFRIGVVPRGGAAGAHVDSATLLIPYDAGIGGVATSGWRGRSHSLGIADAVTVLAADAATADAAATLIGNAVDIESDKVSREPACASRPDSDLGTRLVTVAVAALDAHECLAALRAGANAARPMVEAELIAGAILFLQGRHVDVSGPISWHYEPTTLARARATGARAGARVAARP